MAKKREDKNHFVSSSSCRTSLNSLCFPCCFLHVLVNSLLLYFHGRRVVQGAVQAVKKTGYCVTIKFLCSYFRQKTDGFICMFC